VRTPSFNDAMNDRSGHRVRLEFIYLTQAYLGLGDRFEFAIPPETDTDMAVQGKVKADFLPSTEVAE
jgi:hypothetical protein